ncbi:MAG: MBL fold metallo-hydrolase, partial [Candidatus Aminicenantes bacterium]|nr:MBL fold metallo-hydrolase [Candidatus Aminicenantes bacterium]
MMKNFLALFVTFCFIFIGSAFSLDKSPITITILYDNYMFTEGTQTDWGFSCLIKGTEKTILFDTGTNPDILMHNIKTLGVNPKEVELVVLSHIHGDHTGGLSSFLKENNKVSVYVPISFPDDFKKGVENTGAKIVSVDKPVAICKGVLTTGEMGTTIKEQGVILDTEKGLVFITGCAHP